MICLGPSKLVEMRYFIPSYIILIILVNYNKESFSDLYQNIFDFDSVCKKINEKINLQQYIIISLLVNWIGTICKIRKTAVVKFFQDILPWIFRLQMGKAKDVSKNAENCLRTIKINLEENFTRYYKYDKKSMEENLKCI